MTTATSNNYMSNAQKHSFDEFNGDNFDHKDIGFIRGSNIAVATAGLEGGPIASAMGLVPPPGTPTWGAAYRDFFAKYFARHLVLLSETRMFPTRVTPSISTRTRRTPGACPRPARHLRLAPAERN